MVKHIAYFALIVDEYDRAIEWYTSALGFVLIEDTALSATKRWVVIAPPGSTGSSILLARAASPEQVAAIGNQCGGRVFLFLHTDDFHRDHAALKAKGVEFVREPELQPWGMVAVFRDLYGNLWDLIEPITKDN
ncbi:MAG: VOC family protein [Flavobacteriales bacterium]|nr:VOC family protein [Flavobacteriales bacterium]